ncbi:MAG: DNA mismatch repair endonuclease MutL [Methanosarcinales archaeon]|nr:DNA mismatch repair endonuclease MutL [Methanosarcinales archaeon]
MKRIHVLDEATINKIAAGEVIERPASVVKELIENSIDAGATDIKVEVRGSGTQSIQVTDNGCGMSKDDVSMAFLKHATSKINNARDIEKVMTLGFRGEALSSITAVARVQIITCRADDMAGTRLVIHGPNVVSISDIGAAKGTRILVEDLFYNTPARRKFLKKDKTELAHIVDNITKNALGHNNISFSLSHDGRELFRSPASGGIFDTIVHVYGPETARELIPVNNKTGLAQITGYISRPGYTRGGKDHQVFFINGRVVSSKTVSDALRLGYYTMLPGGRYPVAVLKISMDTMEIDVNVHPTKQQVRFSHELAVKECIAEALRSALTSHELIPQKKKQDQMILSYPEQGLDKEIIIHEEQSGFKVPPTDTNRRLKRTERYLLKTTEQCEIPSDIQVLGQVDKTYIIASTGDGFIIIDQHAAHERILYDQVQGSLRTGTQELITPINLELSSKEKVLIKDYIPYLETFGFVISKFGPDSFAVTSIPTILGKLEDLTVVHDIISDIISQGRIKDETGIAGQVSRSAACRGAIKAGATLSNEQMKSLIAQLYLSKNPHTCPHGRPTIVALTRDDLDKMFKRK